MSLPDDARSAGASTVAAWRLALERRLAALLRRDPELCDRAVEVGIIDRNWLEAPGEHPPSTATPLDVIKRFLERSVERRPSALAAIGLNAIQMLSWDGDGNEEGSAATEVALVFTDLEGFTGYTARNGDDAALALLEDHHRLVGPIVRSRGGHIVKHLGDGLMLSFPSPEAAVHTALELLPTAPEPLRLRAGVHHGEAVVTRDDVIGHVVNITARVTEVAKGGQVLVTVATRDAVGDLPKVRFTRPRRRTFKGVGETVSVCRAEWVDPPPPIEVPGS